MSYFDGRSLAPTDFVKADEFLDALRYNYGSWGSGLPAPAPSIDLPATVEDMEGGTAGFPWSATNWVILYEGPAGPAAWVQWENGSGLKTLPAGSGPAWLLDGLQIGREYTFKVNAARGGTASFDPTPNVRLEVLGTANATEYVTFPDDDPEIPRAELELTFVAEATEHYVAVTTETDWQLSGTGQFFFYVRDAHLTLPPTTLEAHGASYSDGSAEFTDDDPWAEPDIPEQDAGGTVEPPPDPEARDLPESLPAETYLAYLDADGNEITGAGYSRTPLTDGDWEFDGDDAEAVSNADDIEGPTPGDTWPAVASVAIYTAATGGDLVATYPLPTPIPAPSGTPVTFSRNSIIANVAPDPVIRYTTEVMPEPDTVSRGRPVDWEPTSSTGVNWGKLQIIVEGEDITTLLDAPTPFPTITEVEPFGYAAATIRLPQFTTFLTLGDDSPSRYWCKQGANVKVRVKKRSAQGGGYVDLFRGFVEEPVVEEDGSGVTLECTGLLFQADKTVRTPVLSPRVRDCGRVIADMLNAVPGRRYSKMSRRNTGIKTYATGSWEPTLTGAVQQLLATMLDKSGRQWTIALDGREPVLRKKNLTRVDWTIRSGQRGVKVLLQREMTPNVIYGEGVNTDGGRWRNAKYPNWSPDSTPLFPMDPSDAFRVGTRDSDTTTGRGVSDWQEEAGLKVTGVYSRSDADACRDLQREAGIQVDGTVGPQTWAATFATGSNTGTLDGAYIAPLAAAPEVEPRKRGPKGADLGLNPDYNPDVIRVEEAIAFGQNVSKAEARSWVRRTLARNVLAGLSTKNYHGTVRFEIDPAEGHRLEVVRAGSNGIIRGVHGEDVMVHVAHVSMSAGGQNGIVVTATVDTQARDYPTLDAIRNRERNAVDPAKAFIKRRGGQDEMSHRAIFDAESPAGRLPKHALFPNLWTVVQVPFGDYGRVVRTSIRTESSASPFALAVFSKPITAAKLLSIVGNPLTAEENPWSKKADELEDAGLLMAWGWNKQPAGYYPGSFNTPDGESADPVTGRLVDDSPWEFASERSPWVWVASIATSGCTISGRFYQGAI